MLWRELQLDQFWSKRLGSSRKGTHWDQVLFVLVAMANHASTRTTQLYDRRRDEVSLDEVDRIVANPLSCPGSWTQSW